MAVKTSCCSQTTSSCGCAPEPVTGEGHVGVSQINTLAFSSGRCINCGMCVMVCPHGVFTSGNQVVRVVQPDLCMECGACQLNCPVGALLVDSGVGCAAAMINAALRGLDEPTCGCDGDAACC